MNLLIAEILICLLAATLLGVLVGWLFRGALAIRELRAQKGRHKLALAEARGDSDVNELEDRIQQLAEELRESKSEISSLREQLIAERDSVYQSSDASLRDLADGPPESKPKLGIVAAKAGAMDESRDAPLESGQRDSSPGDTQPAAEATAPADTEAPARPRRAAGADKQARGSNASDKLQELLRRREAEKATLGAASAGALTAAAAIFGSDAGASDEESTRVLGANELPEHPTGESAAMMEFAEDPFEATIQLSALDAGPLDDPALERELQRRRSVSN